MAERDIQAAIQIAASQDGHRLFRRNAGKCWVGRMISRLGAIVTLDSARMIELGIEGTPDLEGYSATGKAIYIEVKRPKGRRREAQEMFINAACAKGCLAGFAESVDEARAIWGSNVNVR